MSISKTPPQEHHEWLKGRIEHSNEPSLGKRLRQLAARAGAATRPLIGKRDRWAYTLSQVRNELTHIGPDSKEFHGEDLLFLTESVYAVVRICMLLECGVSPEILTKKANSSSVTWYRDRLKESTERVRSQLAVNELRSIVPHLAVTWVKSRALRSYVRLGRCARHPQVESVWRRRCWARQARPKPACRLRQLEPVRCRPPPGRSVRQPERTQPESGHPPTGPLVLAAR
jgi:ApeA N-terminal domain 1